MLIEKNIDVKIGNFEISLLLNARLMNRINKVMGLSYDELDKHFKNNQFERALRCPVLRSLGFTVKAHSVLPL